MAFPDRTLTRLRRRVFVGELLRVAAAWLAGSLLILGATILAVKLFLPQFWPDVLWLALFAFPMTGLILWQAKRRMPSDRETVALLDRRLGAGGLLMTLTERPDPVWRQRLSEHDLGDALPRIRPVRFAKAIGIPALFAIATGFVPLRNETPPAPQATAATNAAKQLTDAFELLEQASALDEETRTRLERELDELAAEAENGPLTHEKWETVDALREQLRAGLDATEVSVSRGQSAVAAMAAALAAGQPLSIERTEQLTEELREALETLRKNGALNDQAGQPGAGLSSELQRLLKNSEFQLPADAKARQESLAHLKELLDAEAKRLAEARGQCQACLGGDGRTGNLLAQVDGTRPGQGGISRGRADADLTYGDESNEQAVKFKETVLPPGFLDQPNETVQGVSAAALEVDPAGPGERNAARASDPATGKTTWSRSLRPRHRDVVRGYFQDR